MLPDALSWERDADSASQLLVISKGDVEANRDQGFAAPVLLDNSFGLARSVGVRGTPSAVRVDGDGRVASGVAVGAEAVLALARGGDGQAGHSAAG